MVGCIYVVLFACFPSFVLVVVLWSRGRCGREVGVVSRSMWGGVGGACGLIDFQDVDPCFLSFPLIKSTALDFLPLLSLTLFQPQHSQFVKTNWVGDFLSSSSSCHSRRLEPKQNKTKKPKCHLYVPTDVSDFC